MDCEQSCSTGCGCAESSCSCGGESCNCDFYEAMEAKLMSMAFFAQKSALFERIRDRIEKEEGAKLDKMADLVVDAARNRFKDQQEADRKRAELREKIKETFEA